DRRPYNAYVIGAAARQEILEKYRTEQQSEMDDTEKLFHEIVGQYKIEAKYRRIGKYFSIDEIESESFYCDLVILGSPETRTLPEGLTAEQILLKIGIPTVIVPAKWHAKSGEKNIVIAWNASHVVRKAIVDALPIVMTADAVRFLVIDNPDLDIKSGKEIINYLNDKGIKADIQYVESHDLSIAETIIEHAEDLDASLVIMGAYSRSRFTEMFLGGVTKELFFNEVPVPLFISR
ncbi:MAG: universal stress protein, partial [Wohlfahrtiimonas sp.]